MDVLARFMRYVEVTPDCWQWTGASLPRGYGRFYFEGKPRYAHRVALTILRGIRPASGDLVLHACDNPRCVNPDHLSVGTQTDNMRDASRKRRVRNNSNWKGERNPKAKLTAEETRLIAASLGNTSATAARYGVSTVRIQQIRRAKKNGGGWEEEEF